MNLEILTEDAILAAKIAGKFLLDNKSKSKKIFQEIGRDIKLDLDRNTEKLIKKSLSHTGFAFLGEEFGGHLETNPTWVIDPIDGTANYFKQLDQCCISIALMTEEKSYIGVIYNFNSDDLYVATKGKGAFLNGESISVSDTNSRNKAFLTTGFPASESIESSIEFLEDLRDWNKIRMFGSAALSCAYVASGKCDFYTEKGVYLWDFAAGICLVREAGGNVEYTALDDQRYSVKFSNNLL